MRKMLFLLLPLLVVPLIASRSYDPHALDMMKVLYIDASTREERTQIASLGIAIEGIYDGFIIGLAFDEQIEKLSELGFHFQIQTMPAFLEDFPPQDSDFHNVKELTDELQAMAEKYPDMVTLSVIGESIEKRPLHIVRISGPQNEERSVPGIIFLGTHHAREHISTEVPFYLIKYLVENYGKDEGLTKLINDREIWVMPLVNPDGADYDVQEPPYKWWRKNRRGDDAGRVFGVDLNRNYGYQWGGEGAGTDPYSETYRGAKAFSEPETQAVKHFLEAHNNITILLSYHNFSELILYPWGHTYDSIQNQKDLKVHEVMAQKMGTMTGYRPQQSSDLYITSGDTTDWAYGDLKIVSFTFELYPGSLMEGGFYPSAERIQEVVKNNLPPALYLIGYADNPYRALEMNLENLFTMGHPWSLRLH